MRRSPRFPRARRSGEASRGLGLLASATAAVAALTLGLLSISAPAAADGGAEWAHWRGPQRNGMSAETGLPDSWSTDGENLLWRRDFTGRSTPVVVHGRVCAVGRVGEGISRQETAACWDAASGELLWQKRWNVYHTTVPWNRVGWASPTADPETGYLYVQGVGGLFFCFDSADGRQVWSKQLVEELGFMEGYGGRTQTPLVDEGRVVVHFASTNWADQSQPLHRIYAFDKLTGETLWASSPAASMSDKNTQSTPAVAVIAGRRLVIAGNGSGWIYAVEARTGKPVWSFELSKRGINTSVVVSGETVYAAHSEENLDEPTMGRVVAIDATGEGNVTKTHEKWRLPLGVGFASPALAGGVLYLVDNGAGLHAVDAATGRPLWEHSLGTVGKAAPVVADGKIYATEVNGHFHILRPGESGVEVLDEDKITMPDGRYAEIYGSPAVAGGRIYFTTEEGIYCLADAGRSAAAAATAPFDPGAEEPVPPGAAVATLLVVPAEVRIEPGESVDLRVEAFDALGRSLGARPVEWSLEGLSGTVLPDGRYTPDAEHRYQTGSAIARLAQEGGAVSADISGKARIRVVPELPFADDLEGWQEGDVPDYLFSYRKPWTVGELDGEKVIVKEPSARKLNRHHTLIGPRPDLSGYTIQADVRGTRTGRRLPDIGLINDGYVLDLMGAHQQIQVRSWAAALRMAQQFPFAWEPDTWYTIKLRVDHEDGKAVIRGKVWPRAKPEPEEWTVRVEDPYPIASGSPGLIAYSPTPLYYDNLSVTANP